MRKVKHLIYLFQNIVFRINIIFNKKINIGFGLKIKGFPQIYIRNGGKIILGNNVTLNSSNYGYHLNMHSKVKLMADRLDSKILVGDNTRIHGSCIHAYKKISIGKNCLIAANSQIFDGNGHDLCLENPENRINTLGDAREVNISDNVWIGANCIILPGVTIGEGSVVAAGSVVVKDVPPRCVVAGNPAKVVKSLN